MRRIVGLYFLFFSAFHLQAQLSEQQFLRPEATYAPSVVWKWNYGNVNREGINLDLEAMAATGLGGGLLRFSTDSLPADRVGPHSMEWKELVDHAFQQADRLGLKFTLQNPMGIGTNPATFKPSSFNDNPAVMKAEVDSLFLQGCKRLILQTFVHQPHPTPQPDLIKDDFGSCLNRNNTWFNKATDYFQYIRRCQYVLQSGLNVADAAYYLGEDSAHFQTPNHSFDILSLDALLQQTSVKNGRLTLPDGRDYRFLILPSVKTLSISTLRKVKGLLEEGLWVSASKPTNWSGQLTSNEQAEWRSIVEELWNNLPNGVYRFGSGRLYINMPSSQLVKDANLQPDFGYISSNPKASVGALHFRVGEDQVWFINNKRGQNETVLASFRVLGMQPEWWDPSNGQIRDLDIFRQHDEQTLIPFTLESCESGFVVFRKQLRKTVYDGLKKDGLFLISPNPDDCLQDTTVLAFDKRTEPLPETLISNGLRLFRSKGNYRLILPGGVLANTLVLKKDLPIYDLSTDWLIRFPDGGGTTSSYIMDTLKPLHPFLDPGVRAFSGTASWQRSISLTPYDLEGNHLILDLGHVAVLAEIYVNGHSAGICWKPPFRMEITPWLKPGVNQLDVRVTNLWVNRLKGDHERNTFENSKQNNQGSTLVESSLIRPVSLSIWKAMKKRD